MQNLFSDAFQGKRVFLTGHTGFKGSWLSLWLHSLGAEVTGYALEPQTEPAMFTLCQLEQDVNHIIGDVRDYEHLTQAMRECRPDIVFHLAAQPLVRYSYAHARETYETNVMGTVNVLEAVKSVETVQAVVVITSDKCYENKEWEYGYREIDPMGGYDPYSSSKGCAELVVAAYRKSFFNERGIALASARAGNVIGGGDWAEDRLIPDFVRAVVAGRELVIRSPNAIRPWQHVMEPLAGYLQLAALMYHDSKIYADCWNFGPREDNVMTVEQVLQQVIKVWGAGSFSVGISPSAHEAQLLKLDISKVATYLNWYPKYDANKTIRETIHWYKAFLNGEDMKAVSLQQIGDYEARMFAKKIQ